MSDIPEDPAPAPAPPGPPPVYQPPPPPDNSAEVPQDPNMHGRAEGDEAVPGES